MFACDRVTLSEKDSINFNISWYSKQCPLSRLSSVSRSPVFSPRG